MMKKLSVLLALVMLFSLCMAGCGGGDAPEAGDTSLDDIKANGMRAALCKTL